MARPSSGAAVADARASGARAGGLGRLGGARRARGRGIERVARVASRGIGVGLNDVDAPTVDREGTMTNAKEGKVGRRGGAAAAFRSVARASLIAAREREIVGNKDTEDGVNWTSAMAEISRDGGELDDAYKRVLFMTPEDGFIMGANRTLYHLRGCPCPTCNVFRCRVRNGVDANDDPVEVVVISDSEFETLKSVGSFKDMTKVEQIRRRKIGSANTGKVPWNKGGKHSRKTIEKIRATTLMHMQDPEYRERLKRSYNCANARHSEFTRAKIKKASVDRAKAKKIERMALESEEVWGRKSGNNGIASSGLFYRRNSAVISVSFGTNGAADIERLRERQRVAEKERAANERELRKQVAAVIIEKRKALRKEKSSKIPNKRSREHRAKISAAIQTKWRDPAYASKMRKQKRKNANTSHRSSVASTSLVDASSRSAKSSKQLRSVDPSKVKLLAEIKAMSDKAEAAVAALQARAASGLAVDPSMLAQATTAASQTRAMMDKVQRSIASDIPKSSARPR